MAPDMAPHGRRIANRSPRNHYMLYAHYSRITTTSIKIKIRVMGTPLAVLLVLAVAGSILPLAVVYNIMYRSRVIL